MTSQQLHYGLGKWIPYMLLFPLGIGAGVAALYLPYSSNLVTGMTLALVMFLCIGVAYCASYMEKRTEAEASLKSRTGEL